MRKQNKAYALSLAMVALVALALSIQGCGGHRAKFSTVSGTVSDIYRNVVVDATVWVDDDTSRQAKSLISGTYRLDYIESGWRTVRASATVNGELWVGSTAAEILKDEPTMNINIVLAPIGETTEIGGRVSYYVGGTEHRVPGARVLLTTRIVYPPEDTSSYDGPYGSIVAFTDENGWYVLEDAPIGLSGIISASKVGFTNTEVEIATIGPGMIQNFTLVESDLEYSPAEPILEAIEAYTMPDTLTRSDDRDAFKAIRAFTSPRYRKAISQQRQILTRATPAGSLIEIDLYWNALDLNESYDMAGYGIYRTLSPAVEMKAIDFVRDPYANFYGDTGIEITPYQNYYYAVTAVDVQFLDEYNNPDPASESVLSNPLSVAPLGQLRAISPSQGALPTARPLFQWSPLQGAACYAVYVYDRFPALPLDPSWPYYSDEEKGYGIFPIWPTTADPGGSTTLGTSIQYPAADVPALQSGHTYYWVVLGMDDCDEPIAFSYGELRHFTVR